MSTNTATVNQLVAPGTASPVVSELKLNWTVRPANIAPDTELAAVNQRLNAKSAKLVASAEANAIKLTGKNRL